MAVCALLIVAGLCQDVAAQALPGTRAAGMADAFVAVADDGSAVYWNPSGLVAGPLFKLQIDFGSLGEDDGADDRGSGLRSNATLVAVTAPPVGLSYYRLRSTMVGAPRTAEPGQLDREGEVRGLQTLVTHHIGVTVLQSIGEWLTVGATAKVVAGTAGAGVAASDARPIDAWLDEAAGLETDGNVRADVDVGAMVSAGQVRVGFVGRNLAEPTFGAEVAGVRAGKLEREARVGVAWGSAWPSETTRLVIAADADLTRRMQASGERRDVAAGVETWWRERRLGLRAGARASTVGESRTVVTGGASAAVRAGMFVDGYAAFGEDEARGWGLGFRVVF